jgi:colanic acid/amylovoran biosynthesis glycosyltransferase
MKIITINIFVNSFPKVSETFIYNKVKGLLENNYKVNLIVSELKNDSKGFYNNLDQYDNFNLYISYLSRARKIKTLFATLFSINFWKSLIIDNSFNFKKTYKEYLALKTLKIDGPDIIHFAFSGIGFSYLEYLKKIKGAIIGSSFRGASENIKPLVDTKRMVEFPVFLNKIDYYHCVSKNMATQLLKYQANPNKFFINYPSIDTNVFSYLKKYRIGDKINIVTIGRLHWKKGIDIALLALSKLKEKNYDFNYTIIGEGLEYEKLVFMTHNLGVEKNVNFVPFIPSQEVVNYLKESHIFLLPSYSEGLSNSALEAMSTGIPIVSSKAGGMEEAISHKKNGFLFNIGDIEELSNILEEIFNNEFDLEKIRNNAYKTVKERFSIELQNEKFNRFYEKIINEKYRYNLIK